MAYAAWSVIAGETPTATKWNILGTNDADFDTRVTQLVSDKTLGVVSDGATIDLDLSVRKLFSITIAGNRALTASNVASNLGIPFTVRIKQGSGGSRLISSWFSGVTINWPGASAPTLSTVEGEIDIFNFIPISETEFDATFAGFGLKAP